VHVPHAMRWMRFTTPMHAYWYLSLREGAADQVPLKVTTQPEAGTPPAHRHDAGAIVPATEGDVPQFVVHVGAVVCAVRNAVAPVPEFLRSTAPVFGLELFGAICKVIVASVPCEEKITGLPAVDPAACA
jgi:hypothetical protein